ncbi:L-erythro-3,5-diaminohexanoate dehydrogenase [Vallitalea okinawensis]|uniref:L-erythro-3,5-diaminohexanoate dehydrogenase n=1 Tax=Vallitalea okinawensis TaxID=2078660 RepID=UPI000CFAFD1F|nr:zinc-binding dehydrogenase [Vallitalea okinawensis]
MKGCKFGTHRVIEPKGCLPQAAKKIDSSMKISSNEIKIDVRTLNIDSASFTQIKEACHKDVEKMTEMITTIVSDRGKMQNPVTGSGGMLIGTVIEIGDDFPDQNLKIGDKIATLVSLSLTPLKINNIKKIHLENDQVDIDGQAILFESGLYAVLPEDLPEKVALAALDVAGAPAQVDKLVKSGDRVLIIGGGGKSGILCCYQAMKKLDGRGQLIVIEYDRENAKRIKEMGLAHHVIIADARKAVDVYEQVVALTNGEGVDVTINNVNIMDTEMASILPTKDDGVVYFFSMATSFTKSALGAEGVGRDVTMIVGNGYTKGHAELTLNLLRESKEIRDLFHQLYA